MTTDAALWQISVRLAAERQLINVGGMHTLDENVWKALFMELIRVRARVTPKEARETLSELWPGMDRITKRQIVALWRHVLDNPTHAFKIKSASRTYPLRRPFKIVEAASSDETVRVRLLDAAAAAHRALLECADEDAEQSRMADVEKRARTAEWALRVWAASRVAAENQTWTADVLTHRKSCTWQTLLAYALPRV